MKGHPTAVFRTNASSAIGMGHLMRCVALAEELVTRGWRVAFAVRGVEGEDPYGILRLLTKDVTIIPPRTARKKDIDALCKVSAERKAAMVVVDSYEADARYLRTVQASGRPVVFIDDMARVRSGMDALLNYNAGFSKRDYERISGTKLLVGLQYCILNRKVRARRSRMTVPPEQPDVASRLLLTLGAGRHNELVERILKVLSSEDWLQSVNVTTGPSGKREDRRFHFIGFRNDLPSVIAQHPLVLTGGGSTCYQLACLGVPSMIFVLAENQRRVAEGLDGLGLGRNLGAAKPFRSGRLSEALGDLANDRRARAQMAVRAFKAVDGLGTRRVAEALEAMFL